jgi:hypothetical protein
MLIKTAPIMNSIQPLIFPRFVFLTASCKYADLACLTMTIPKSLVYEQANLRVYTLNEKVL